MGETYTSEIRARYRDMNLSGHVDNVEALRVLDEARLELFHYAPLPGLPEGAVGLLHGVDTGVSELVATQTVSYHAEMRFVPYQPFHATLWLTRIGTSSLTVAGELRLGGEPDAPPAVVWECVNVLWNHPAQASWPINDAVRARMERYLGEPAAVRR